MESLNNNKIYSLSIRHKYRLCTQRYIFDFETSLAFIWTLPGHDRDSVLETKMQWRWLSKHGWRFSFCSMNEWVNFLWRLRDLKTCILCAHLTSHIWMNCSVQRCKYKQRNYRNYWKNLCSRDLIYIYISKLERNRFTFWTLNWSIQRCKYK